MDMVMVREGAWRRADGDKSEMISNGNVSIHPNMEVLRGFEWWWCLVKGKGVGVMTFETQHRMRALIIVFGW